VATAVGLLIAGWETAPAPRFLVGVGGGLLAVSVVIGRPISRAPDQPVTLATTVTLSRGAALAVFAGFLPVGLPSGRFVWFPAALFALAAGLDAIDGRIARRMDAVSELGGRLDTEMDGLTVLFGTVFVVTADLVPAVFLLVGVARYLFVAGIWLRKRRGVSVRMDRTKKCLWKISRLVICFVCDPVKRCRWMVSLPKVKARLMNQ
jgi:CDP-diacylglycerol--glycerol-3-phosphate 3-phosphatidyltransferase